MNTVIAGDYQGKWIRMPNDKTVLVELGLGKTVRIDKQSVKQYDLAQQNTKTGFSVGKAVLGAAAFGDIGVVAGAGGKQKSTYQVIVYFRDGKKSLLEVDEKIYKAITVNLFDVENYNPVLADSALAPPKAKKHIVLRIVIFVIFIFICLVIAQAVFPVVDGTIELNGIGTIFVIGVPLAAAILLPNLVFKSKK